MSEVPGKAGTGNTPIGKAGSAKIPVTSDVDDDSDDGFDDDFDDLDEVDYVLPGTGFFSTIASPLTLALTSLVLAAMSLVGLLSTYLLTNAIGAAHTTQDPLFAGKITTALELGMGVIAGILAVVAHSAGAHDADAAKHRIARAMAGAAFLLSLLSVAQSLSALFLLAGAHAGPAAGG